MGIFVTFEGIECCGKSTQLLMLSDWLRKNSYDIVTTREPGGTKLGENIRNLLRDGNKYDAFSSRAEILLFEASRAQHVEEKIFPALNAGKIVLCDRFFDSTSVYQGAARNISANIVGFLNEFAAYELIPTMTILLDISVTESFERLSNRDKTRDRIEQEDRCFFEKVRTGYLNLASKSDRFFLVDGVGDSQKIHEIIKNEFTRRFL